MTSRPGPGPALAVTSSTGVMGLAVGHLDAGGVAVLAEVEVPTERRHAEEISPRLTELLGEAGLGLADLTRLVIDIGPGRFTGLRVGLATVRALGFALDIPVTGLTSLEVLAAGAERQPDGGAGPVTAVIDARRSEVFQQPFAGGEPLAPPSVGPPAELATAAAGPAVGDGADRYAELYAAAGVEVVAGVHPRAATMLALAADRPAVPGTGVHPLYLRDPDATPNIRTRAGAEPAVGGVAR